MSSPTNQTTDGARIVCALVYQRNAASAADPALLRAARQRLATLLPGVPLFAGGVGAPETVAAAGAQPQPVLPATGDGLFAGLRAALEETGQDEQDSAAVFYDWYPLLDEELAGEMIADHFRYLAHYSYCDNVPPGLLPDLASLEFVRAVEAAEIGTTDLREFVFKNVNRFDVEIFYRMPDLRQYRLDVSTGSERSRRLAREIAARRPDLRFAGLADLVREQPELLRPYPSYFEIELTRAAPLRPVFLPRPEDFAGDEPAPVERAAGGAADGPELDFGLIEKLLVDLREYSPGDATVALAGTGEPLRHSRADEILARLLAEETIRCVYLETYGIDLGPQRLRALAALPGAEKLSVILRLATLQPERYRALYGGDELGRVLENLAAMESLDAPLKVYAEMPRLSENADEIDAYFERFESSKIQVILGKYNNYAGRLPERRAADLTPLHRDFCWHLARDFYLTAEGRVPLCKQDPFALRGPFQDFTKEGVGPILAATAEFHAASVQGRHDAIPSPCLRCDEWYTFNG